MDRRGGSLRVVHTVGDENETEPNDLLVTGDAKRRDDDPVTIKDISEMGPGRRRIAVTQNAEAAPLRGGNLMKVGGNRTPEDNCRKLAWAFSESTINRQSRHQGLFRDGPGRPRMDHDPSLRNLI
jgi:hypothetical protein